METGHDFKTYLIHSGFHRHLVFNAFLHLRFYQLVFINFIYFDNFFENI